MKWLNKRQNKSASHGRGQVAVAGEVQIEAGMGEVDVEAPCLNMMQVDVIVRCPNIEI